MQSEAAIEASNLPAKQPRSKPTNQPPNQAARQPANKQASKRANKPSQPAKQAASKQTNQATRPPGKQRQRRTPKKPTREAHRGRHAHSIGCLQAIASTAIKSFQNRRGRKPNHACNNAHMTWNNEFHMENLKASIFYRNPKIQQQQQLQQQQQHF